MTCPNCGRRRIRKTPSAESQVKCRKCRHLWKPKAEKDIK